MVSEGERFPDFSLQDQDGKVWTNGDLKGGKAVIYFYPKDDTPGCTTESCGFQAALPRVEGATILGVSPDDTKSHRKFADKFGLQFTLLADVGHKLADACGVWGEKSMYGKKYMGVLRTTFLVDEAGVVSKVFADVKPQGHADEVLKALSALNPKP